MTHNYSSKRTPAHRSRSMQRLPSAPLNSGVRPQMTYLDVLDTAVKIGLGAVIATAGALVSAKISHGREVAKEWRTRKCRVLEDVAELTENFSNAVLRYWALISELGALRAKDKSMAPERVAKLQTAQEDVWSAWKDISVSEARLLLLGLEEAQKLCREYGELVTRFMKIAWPEGPSLSREESLRWRSELLSARASFYKALSAAYVAIEA